MEDLLDHDLIFDMVGGVPTFEKIAELFYAKINHDQLLRPMFPENLEPGKKLQALFLAQKFGGPRDYEKLRGHAMLRKRHMKFPIGIPERNRWVVLMLDTLIEVGIDDKHKAWPTLKEYFERVGTKMINKGSERFSIFQN